MNSIGVKPVASARLGYRGTQTFGWGSGIRTPISPGQSRVCCPYTKPQRKSPGPDSNRRVTVCSRLPDHSATRTLFWGIRGYRTLPVWFTATQSPCDRIPESDSLAEGEGLEPSRASTLLVFKTRPRPTGVNPSAAEFNRSSGCTAACVFSPLPVISPHFRGAPAVKAGASLRLGGGITPRPFRRGEIAAERSDHPSRR